MAIDREREYRQMAARGKYRKLYAYLCALQAWEWRATFREIESIAGFELPKSARFYRPWWANQNGGSGHSQALAWGAAGWETAEVDMDSETLVLRRKKAPRVVRERGLDDVWPVHPTAAWPEAGLSLRREDIYGDRA